MASPPAVGPRDPDYAMRRAAASSGSGCRAEGAAVGVTGRRVAHPTGGQVGHAAVAGSRGRLVDAGVVHVQPLAADDRRWGKSGHDMLLGSSVLGSCRAGLVVHQGRFPRARANLRSWTIRTEPRPKTIRATVGAAPVRALRGWVPSGTADLPPPAEGLDAELASSTTLRASSPIQACPGRRSGRAVPSAHPLRLSRRWNGRSPRRRGARTGAGDP
jgi:hypothetical protein